MSPGVLVLDGTPRTVVPIARSLRSHQIPVVSAGLDHNGLSVRSNSVLADVALCDTPHFLNDTLALISRYCIDTVLPCSDRALRLLLANYDQLKLHVTVPLPKPETVARVLSKEATIEIARSCGVPLPRTFCTDDVAAMMRLRTSLSFPIVAKPVRVGGEAAFKVKYFYSGDELEQFLGESPEVAANSIFQEYVPGDGVGISAVAVDGKPLMLFQHRRIHECPAMGGVACLFRSEALDTRLVRATVNILQNLRWRGPAMVEFRHNRRSDEYFLMEINGRFWGSLALAIQAGVDFPYILWEVIHGVQPALPPAYDDGLTMRWTSGELLRFAELIRKPNVRRRMHYNVATPFVQIGQAFAPSVRSALYSREDRLPATVDVLDTLRVALRRATVKIFRALLPNSVRGPVSALRLMNGKGRRAYILLGLRRLARTHPARRERLLSGVRRIALVCRGNRIRSPLAAAALESDLNGSVQAKYDIMSAGTRVSTDSTFDARAFTAANGYGLVLAGKPRQLSADVVERADLIVAMDRIVEAELLADFPQAAHKVALPGEIAPSPRNEPKEIPDPDTASPEEFSFAISRVVKSMELLARGLS